MGTAARAGVSAAAAQPTEEDARVDEENEEDGSGLEDEPEHLPAAEEPQHSPAADEGEEEDDEEESCAHVGGATQAHERMGLQACPRAAAGLLARAAL